jgi:hypothetical protein
MCDRTITSFLPKRDRTPQFQTIEKGESVALLRFADRTSHRKCDRTIPDNKKAIALDYSRQQKGDRTLQFQKQKGDRSLTPSVNVHLDCQFLGFLFQPLFKQLLL